MAIRISIEHLQSKIEANKETNQNTEASAKVDPSPSPKDLVDLGQAWSAATSPIIQNMNQYVLSAHKISNLAQDFHRLLKDEFEQDEARITPPLIQEESSDTSIPFNDFSGVNLQTLTGKGSSVDEALRGFIERSEQLREAEAHDKMVNGFSEKRLAEEQEDRTRIKHIRSDKIILEKKLERITNPKVDIVIEKGHNEYLEKKAQPKPKPDVSREKNEYIMKHPKPDKARQKLDEMEHERYMESFSSTTVKESKKKKKSTS
ncbi:MAG: hypothetical protein IPJ69_10350 [Deltaproteobacteria bacterium]|nr:MAG: hypothetical protein IPJ69_10350 [Deltaproteobacteria bacterium]